jgi:membrane associated rhomboid family serine protease
VNSTSLAEAEDRARRTLRTKISYQAALSHYRSQHGLARIPWVTWTITSVTLLCWCFTACATALSLGAHSVLAVLNNISSNAINVQPTSDDALTNILITYGAKDNKLIIQGQYWRFVTPIFLHVNVLHVGLNMLNLLLLGIFLERIMGHTRFLLVYLVTGVVSIITSFYFAPDVISVGASGAIFGLVGAYSSFVLLHRRAFRNGGLFALLWLVFIIGINLGVGVVIPNVDNYAHVGGLVSGCLLGCWFTPLYIQSAQNGPTSATTLVDTHRLARSWPLALLTILGTLLLAIIALYTIGTKS